MKKIVIICLLAASTLLVLPVQATVQGSLVFTDPTGNVSGSEGIDVWVTLTLDADSDPLVYNKSSEGFPNGVDSAHFPTEGRLKGQSGLVPFATYDQIGWFFSRSCDDTFAIGCSDSGSEYSYSPYFGDGSWAKFDGTIDAGESRDFLFYQLSPVGGMAAAGAYELFTTSLGLRIFGKDSDKNEMSADLYSFSTTCDAANCTFTRTVSAVPVPAAAWLFGSALLGLGVIKRKKD